jgi:uncharacterized protein
MKGFLGNALKPLFLTVGLLSMTLGNPAIAQERLLRTLTVTGRGMEAIATTLAQVQLGVEVQGKSADEVQQEIARRSTAVVTLLKARNVEKLETTGVRLNPVYSYTNNVQRLVGYQGTNTVSFRVDTQRAGVIVDDAVKAGASRIDGISFVATESAIAAAQKQALREATEEAQQQANAVLSSLNLTPKEIVNIQVNGANAPTPPPMFAASEVANLRKASTPIMGGEQQVEANVTLQISY